MFIGAVLSAVDVAIAHPLDGDAAPSVVAAEFVLTAHSLLAVFRFICFMIDYYSVISNDSLIDTI